MRKLSFLLIVLAGFIAWGCSPYTLMNSTVYNNSDIAAFRTFKIATPENDQLPPKMTMTDYYNIANAIRQQLTARGFTESPDSPLLVNFGLTVETNIQTSRINPI